MVVEHNELNYVNAGPYQKLYALFIPNFFFLDSQKIFQFEYYFKVFFEDFFRSLFTLIYLCTSERAHFVWIKRKSHVTKKRSDDNFFLWFIKCGLNFVPTFWSYKSYKLYNISKNENHIWDTIDKAELSYPVYAWILPDCIAF